MHVIGPSYVVSRLGIVVAHCELLEDLRRNVFLLLVEHEDGVVHMRFHVHFFVSKRLPKNVVN